MLSSRLRSFSFSLPSADVQSPSSRSCTFRVGPDVIGASYSQALKKKIARQTIRPEANAAWFEHDEFTIFVDALRAGLSRNNQSRRARHADALLTIILLVYQEVFPSK